MATFRSVALLTLASVALKIGGANVSPLAKVVEMLDALQREVITEGKEEANTYDKFSCWCKDISREKTQDITEGQDDVDRFSAEIAQLATERNEFDHQMNELNQAIDDMSAKIKSAMGKRARKHVDYLRLKKELEDSQENCELAGTEIQNKLGGGTFLLSVARNSKPLQHVLRKARALGFQQEKHRKVFSVFLQQDPSLSVSPSMEGVLDEGNSQAAEHLMDTVHDIEGDFGATLDQMKRDEFKAIGVHQVATQSLRQQKEKLEKDYEKAKERRDWRHEDIAEVTSELTEATAVLKDDQKYLSELTERCNDASQAWDQRSVARQNELTVLTQAMLIIKEKSIGEHRLVRMIVLQREAMPRDALVGGPKVEAAGFLQVSAVSNDRFFAHQIVHPTKHRLRELRHQNSRAAQNVGDFVRNAQRGDEDHVESPQSLAIGLLKERSQQLGSALLAHLASQVSSDPFAKVKQIIQELTERLLQEAADEANQKGWCDKELSKNKQKKTSKVGEIRHLNARLQSGEVKRDTLKNSFAQLGKEIAALTNSLEVASKERAAESAENMTAAKEAEQGQNAITEAYTILDRFYRTAAKAELRDIFLQARSRQTSLQPEEVAPESGVDGPYKGRQNKSVGILAMLDIIRSDFDRSYKTVIQQEKKAQKDFLALETEAKISISTKGIAKAAFGNELAGLASALAEDKQNLISAQALLDKSLQELAGLRSTCMDTGMSHEERETKREQEIESLKEVLCIFDKNTC